MTGGTVAAIDLGATSGRVIVGHVTADRVAVDVIRRFPNAAIETPDGLHWSMLDLYRQAGAGLNDAVCGAPDLASVGIDTWACDYALMRRDRLLGAPYCYRDERTATAVEEIHRVCPPDELYRRNGLQYLPFTSLYQLAADRSSGFLELADRFLMLPDLISFWLTGVMAAERTNASTTGLLSAHSRDWDRGLAADVGITPALLSPLADPGTAMGGLCPSARRTIDAPHLQVTTVGSHDTASAVVALPTPDPDVAYISCGTWSLVGVELEDPILTDAARMAGFTNELGVDNRVRFLHNVIGLWILSETVRDWERDGTSVDLSLLIAQAADVTDPVPIFDADDREFLTSGDMVARIGRHLRSHGAPVPHSRPAFIRCILASLAEVYARTIRDAASLSATSIKSVHIVGGGSQNALLCQLTADATGLPTFAGPVEATAIGNVMVQARSLGWITGDLEVLRDRIASSFPTRRYTPRQASR